MDKILRILYLSETDFEVKNGTIKVMDTYINKDHFDKNKITITNKHLITFDSKHVIDVWGGDLYLNIILPHTVLQIRINNGGDDYTQKGDLNIDKQTN